MYDYVIYQQDALDAICDNCVASLLQKEGLSPDRVAEALTDFGRIEAIIRAEYEEQIRKAIERIKTTPDKEGEPKQ